MAKIRQQKITGSHIDYWFNCPGCSERHALNNTWKFNGNLENPTFSPSIKVTWSYADVPHV